MFHPRLAWLAALPICQSSFSSPSRFACAAFCLRPVCTVFKHSSPPFTLATASPRFKFLFSDLATPGTSKQSIAKASTSPDGSSSVRKRKRSKGKSNDDQKSKRIPMKDLSAVVNGKNHLNEEDHSSPSSSPSPKKSPHISGADNGHSPASNIAAKKKAETSSLVTGMKNSLMNMLEKPDRESKNNEEKQHVSKNKDKRKTSPGGRKMASDTSSLSSEEEAKGPLHKNVSLTPTVALKAKERPKGRKSSLEQTSNKKKKKVEKEREEKSRKAAEVGKTEGAADGSLSGETSEDEMKEMTKGKEVKRKRIRMVSSSSSSQEEEEEKVTPKEEKVTPKEEEKVEPKEKDRPEREDGTEKPNHPFFGSCKMASKKDSATKSDAGKTGEFDPSLQKYHPIDHAIWSRGESVPYLALARTLELIEGTSARLKMVEIMANYLRSVILLSPEDLLPSLYLCLNRLAPAWEGLELGVAETTLLRAIAQSTGRTIAGVKEEAVRKGDLGLVAEGARGSQSKLSFMNAASSSRLTVKKVMAELKAVASLTGQTSMSKKLYRIVTLFVACRGPEMRYLVRSLSGKLRVGLAEQSVLQALALACTLSPPAQKSSEFPPPIIDSSSGKGINSDSFKSKLDANVLCVKTAYCECPSFERLVEALLEGGIDVLPNRCQLSPGLPPKPMLAHPTKGVSEVLTRFDSLTFTCEYKYDGERAQIHLLEDGSIKIFSRNQEDNTSKYPDVIGRLSTCFRTYSERDEEEAKIAKEEKSEDGKEEEKEGQEEDKEGKEEKDAGNEEDEEGKKEEGTLIKNDSNDEECSVKTCILDCEAVAWDVETETILPFQKLATRKRKDANESDIKVQVCLFMFDLLYLNGESLVSEPLSKRRHLLRTHFKRVPGQFEFARSMDTSSTEEVEAFLDEAIKGNCEGLMVKTLAVDATYQIARRSRNWLKLKKDYLESGGNGGIGDSLDLVVIGGYPGKGKRTGNYGGFLLACYDPESETYQSICKIGTGFTEEDLSTLSESLRPNILNEPRPYFAISPGLHPLPKDWFDPSAVWEIKCADLSLSPVHRAAIGLVDPEKGISLRFPRFKRVRDDKKPEEATSSEQIAEMYKGQEQVKNSQASTKAKFSEEDFY